MARYNVGDFVVIVDADKCYTTYDGIIEQFKNSQIAMGVCESEYMRIVRQYHSGRSPVTQDLLQPFTVVGVYRHQISDKGLVYVINGGRKTFLMGEEGIMSQAEAQNIKAHWTDYIHYLKSWIADHAEMVPNALFPKNCRDWWETGR